MLLQSMKKIMSSPRLRSNWVFIIFNIVVCYNETLKVMLKLPYMYLIFPRYSMTTYVPFVLHLSFFLIFPGLHVSFFLRVSTLLSYIRILKSMNVSTPVTIPLTELTC
jgi:hypothetical protein